MQRAQNRQSNFSKEGRAEELLQRRRRAGTGERADGVTGQGTPEHALLKAVRWRLPTRQSKIFSK